MLISLGFIMPERRINRLQESLGFVEIIKLLKEKYTYKELSEEVNVPIPVLNRYVKGQVIPAPNKTKQLLERFNELFDLREELKRRMNKNRDCTQIFLNTPLMKIIAFDVYSYFGDSNIQKILTAPIDGLPIAIPIAHFFGAGVTYVKNTRDQSIENYIEETYKPNSANFIQSFFLDKNTFQKNENILIVDDIIDTGVTVNALINLAKKFKVNIKGIFALISQNGGVDKIKDAEIPVYTIFENGR